MITCSVCRVDQRRPTYVGIYIQMKKISQFSGIFLAKK